VENKEIIILWSIDAEDDLESIFDYYFKLSEQSAERIRKDILEKISTLRFVKQYQIDEVNPNYRRIIVGHYKVVYKAEKQTILILNIFDTRQDPTKSKI
jgi:plasmid stabilization system protein ParE